MFVLETPFYYLCRWKISSEEHPYPNLYRVPPLGFQLSVIGQLTSSCIISNLVCKEQPIKIQYFNMGNNKEKYLAAEEQYGL